MLAVAAGVYLAKKGMAGAAAAAVGAVVDTATGAVLGIGDAIGVPRTDAEACAAAKARGDAWAASLYCPATDFAAYGFNAAMDGVQTAAAAVGIPRTNETECERAKREGRTLDASFACPAGDFLSYLFK